MSMSISAPTASSRLTTLAVGVAAAGTTTAAAAVMRAAGTHLSAGGEIPLLGFAQITFICVVAGGLLVAVANRRQMARGRFVQGLVVLTAVSCVPSLASGDGTGSKIGLVALHLLAAVIVIPVLARLIAD